MSSQGAERLPAGTLTLERILQTVVYFRSWIILVTLLLFFSVMLPPFFQSYSFYNFLLLAAPLSIAAIGQSFCLISKNIDLSVGNLALLTGYIVAWLSAEDPTYASGLRLDPILAIVIALIIATLLGLANGLLVAKIGLHPFLATIATSLIFRSAALVMAEGHTISGLPEKVFSDLGRGKTLGVLPYCFILAIILYVIATLILNRTMFGWHVYATGGRRYSAYITGINVKKTIIFVFMLSGLFAGISGVVLTAKTQAATITTAINYEFYTIGVAVLGGISITGGVGELPNALVGALIFGAIEIALSLSGISVFWIRVVEGIVIMIAVITDFVFSYLMRRRVS